MSFILDALKKIEEEKRLQDGDRMEESIRLQRARESRRRQQVRVAGIALVSAAVTLLGLNLVERLRDAASASPPEETVAELSLLAEPGGPTSIPEQPTEPPSPSARSPEPEPKPKVAPKLENAKPVTIPDETRPLLEGAGIDAPNATEPAENESQGEAPVGLEVAPPMRVVGVESARRASGTPPPPSATSPVTEEGAAPEHSIEPLEGDRERDSQGESISEMPSELEAIETAPPQGFPELVLQGTSVIDGRPVAVLNERRVFEGDRIEGVLVVRIEERAVVLALDGKQVRIEL